MDSVLTPRRVYQHSCRNTDVSIPADLPGGHFAVQEYIDNIQYVDNIVRKVEQEMRFFFQDDRTAYLFT
jgi:hypothetical protein